MRGALAGVLLAAGAGSRFGGGELLHPLPDGTPIGRRMAQSEPGSPFVTVVIRPGDAVLERALLDAGPP